MAHDQSTPITQERLKDLLHYDPLTGEFCWSRSLGGHVQAGKKAGSAHPDGYWHIRIDGRLYLTHRLAWLYVFGVWPETDIDHRNGDRSDCRIDNLRVLDHSKNTHNIFRPKISNRLKILGVCEVKNRKGLYRSEIQADGAPLYLGCFKDPYEAHAVYLCAKLFFHPTAECFGEAASC